MPVIGEFHGFFWKSKAGAPPVVAQRSPWMYPQWQSVVNTMSMAIWWVPIEWTPLKRWLVRCWSLIATLWRVQPWTQTGEQLAVMNRVIGLVGDPAFLSARAQVRACAQLASFQQPAEWLEFGRALKGDKGQAQNVFRHLWAVRELQKVAPVPNHDAHLLIELAYHGFQVTGRDHAQHVKHKKQHVEQVKQWVVR